MALHFTTSYIEDARTLFRYYKGLADRALAQVSDDQLHAALDPEMNSLAILVKHLAGNMLSRWPNFLVVDGESPTRDRDSEFLDAPPTREALLALWESAWQCAFAEMAALTDADLTRTITIRTEPHSVVQALNRQLGHCAYHTGQIVFLAKHLQSENWKSLSVPRGQSREFNAKVARGDASQR